MASKGTIGAKIVLEGERQYREALKGINLEQKNLRSEMKLCTAEFKSNQNSADALKKKHEILAKQFATQASKVEVYKKAIANSAQKEDEAGKKVTDLKAKLAAAQAEMDKMSKSSDTTADAMEAQKKTIAQLEDELKKAESNYDKAAQQTTKYQTSLNYAEAELKELDSELKKNEGYMKEAEKSADGCATSIDEFGKEVKDTENEVSTFGEVLKANLASEVIVSGIKVMCRAIGDMAKASIESGMAFEASMDKVGALSGATSAELDLLNQKARQLGESTMFSASQAADALGYMALAGWDTQEMLSGIEPVLNLAAAADMDLARASDIVTDYLTAFGLTAEDAAGFTDQLAYAMSHSNTNVDQLGEAYKNCASTAQSMGFAVNDVTAVLMTMANAGVKGGEAGTGLNAIMTRLATNTKGCADVLHGYGVEVYDTYGNLNELSTILEGLGDVWSGLTDKEQANLAKVIAGTSHYSQLQTIMNGVSEAAEAGGQSFGAYSDALKDCAGSASEMATEMQDNLRGKITIMQSALEGLQISFYETFDDELKEVVGTATDAIGKLQKAITDGKMGVSLRNLANGFGNLVDSGIKLGTTVLPPLINLLAGMAEHADLLAAGFTAYLVASTGITKVVPLVNSLSMAYGVLTGTQEASTVAQEGLNLAMLANPIGLVVSAIAALTAGLAIYIAMADDWTDSQDELVKGTYDLVQASEQLNETVATEAETRKRAYSDFEGEEKAISGMIDRLEELNSKTSLTAEEQSEMARVVQELNSAFPSLNLSIDEETHKLNLSTDAIRKNTEEMLRQQKVQAAQDDLVKIADDLYQAEKLRQSQLDQAAETQKKYNEAVAEFTELQKAQIKTAPNSIAMSEDEKAAKDLYDSYQALKGQIQETDESINQLNEDYQYAMDYMADNELIDATADSIDNLGSSAEGTGESMLTMGGYASEALQEMYDSVSSTIESQINMFEEFNGTVDLTTEQLLANMQSQIDGLTEWADNIEQLANRGIDQGLLKELEDMGPEGAGYVALFASMTDEELQKANDMWTESMTLKADTASSVVDSYVKAGENATQGFVDGLESKTSDATDTATKMGEDTVDALETALDEHSPSRKTQKSGENFTLGFSKGIKGKESDATNAVKHIANTCLSTMRSEVRESDYSYIGQMIPYGLAEGIYSGASYAIRAAEQVARQALQAAKSELEINSPSRKFAWLGEMSAEGYKEGLVDNMKDIDKVVKSSMPDMNMQIDAEGGRFEMSGDFARAISSGFGNSMNDQIGYVVALLQQYLPKCASDIVMDGQAISERVESYMVQSTQRRINAW